MQPPKALFYHRVCLRLWTPAVGDLLWKSEMRLKKEKTGDALGRPSWESSLLGDPGAKFFVNNGGTAQKEKNRPKAKRRRLCGN
jgi:hypothetical protein